MRGGTAAKSAPPQLGAAAPGRAARSPPQLPVAINNRFKAGLRRAARASSSAPAPEFLVGGFQPPATLRTVATQRRSCSPRPPPGRPCTKFVRSRPWRCSADPQELNLGCCPSGESYFTGQNVAAQFSSTKWQSAKRIFLTRCEHRKRIW